MRRYVNMAKSGRMAATRRTKQSTRPSPRVKDSGAGGKRRGFLSGAEGRRRG